MNPDGNGVQMKLRYVNTVTPWIFCGTDIWDQRSFNDFTNDSAYLATPWLLRLIQDRGLTVEHLLKVLRLKDGVSTVHVLALLAGGGFVCDCTMPMNMGIPCRHFFAVLKKNPNLKLSIDMINRRCAIP